MSYAGSRTACARTGGSARVVGFHFDDPDQEAQVIADLCAARDDEYGEVLDRVPAFLEELRHERDRDRTTYEEVEESEAEAFARDSQPPAAGRSLRAARER